MHAHLAVRALPLRAVEFLLRSTAGQAAQAADGGAPPGPPGGLAAHIMAITRQGRGAPTREGEPRQKLKCWRAASV